MNSVIYVVVTVVSVFLSVEQILMLVRAVFSWIQPDEGNKIYMFLYYATEPLIAPVRALLERFDAVANMPFDVSFTVTWLLLFVIRLLLPNVK